MEKDTSQKNVLYISNKNEIGIEIPLPLKLLHVRTTSTTEAKASCDSAIQKHVSGSLPITAIIVAWEDDDVGKLTQAAKFPISERPWQVASASSSGELISYIATLISKHSVVPAGMKRSCLTIFTVVVSNEYTQNPYLRELLAEIFRFKMVTNQPKALSLQLQILAVEGNGNLACPSCLKSSLSSDDLWHHVPQHHAGECGNESGVDVQLQCPVCRKLCRNIRDFADHVFHDHAPIGHQPPPYRPDVKLYSFALMVVRRPTDRKFLMVQERCRRGWWLPGGGIDSDEDPVAGGVRETLEEAGVSVKIKGLLSIRVIPTQSYVRMWYIFYGEPEDLNACEAKTTPDHESLGGCWVSIEDVMSGKLHMRGSEPLEWFPYVEKGGTIHPLSILEIGLKKTI